jgi:ketosteroid isomerase-like protein
VNPLEIVKSFYAALGSENRLAALDLAAPSIQWTEVFPGYAGKWTGPDAVRQNLFERLAREWDDYHVAPGSFVAEHTIVVVFGSYTGVYKRNGKSLATPFVHRLEVVDGKITNFQQYTDTALIQAVLR